MHSEASALAAMAAVRAQLGPSCANAAWALYERSRSAETGLYLSTGELCTLCGVANWSSARRILSRLAKFGVLSFFSGHAGAPIHIIFGDLDAVAHSPAPPPPLSGPSQPATRRSDAPMRNSGAQCAEPAPATLAPPDASAAHDLGAIRAEFDKLDPRQRRRIEALLERRRARLSQTDAERAAVDSPNNSSEVVSLFTPFLSSCDPEQTTELPVDACPNGAEVTEPRPADPASCPAAPSADQPPADASRASALCAPPTHEFSAANPHAPASEEERDRSYALLLDPEVGLDVQTARRFAAEHRFEYLLRQVCTWRRDLNAGRVTGPGALIHRVKHGFGCTITNADCATALYRRHMPNVPEDDEDSEAARRRKYLPDEYADIIIG